MSSLPPPPAGPPPPGQPAAQASPPPPSGGQSPPPPPPHSARFSPIPGSSVPAEGASGVSGASVLVGIAAVVVGISIFIEWGTDNLFDRSRSANEIPLQLLWDTTPATFNSLPLRWPLLIGTILMLGSVLKLRAKAGGLIGGIVALATALLYVNAIRAVHGEPLYEIEGGLTDSIGPGTWLCVAGSVLGLIGSIILLRRRTI